MTIDQPRILLADDEDTFRLSTAALLREEGYSCDCAQDSEEASRLLSDRHDVLISDVRMPGNTQLEFLRSVHHRFPSLPIIVVTGYPSVQTAIDSLRLSFVDYLVKPLEWSELKRSVGDAVGRSRLVRHVRHARQEAARLAESLATLEETAAVTDPSTGAYDLALTVNRYLAAGALQMGGLAAEIGQALSAMTEPGHAKTVDLCRHLQCPRLTAYDRALRDAIDVLERTKSAFKSKDLGELRKRLETLLKESPA